MQYSRLEKYHGFNRQRKQFSRTCVDSQAVVRANLAAMCKIVTETAAQLPKEPLISSDIFEKVQTTIEFFTPAHLLKILTVQILALYCKFVDQQVPPKNLVRIEPSMLTVWMAALAYLNKSRCLLQAYKMIAKSFAQ